MPERSLDDEAFILFTSGTTGKPKGAMLTHRNIMANVAQGMAWVGELGEGEQEIYLAALPMFHIFGLTLTAALGVATGGKLCLLPKPEIPLIVDQMKKQRSEEHTSELQSRFDLVCRLLLEKKKTTTT